MTDTIFLKRQVLDASKLKEFAEDNFRVGENDREFSKWVENTVGEGEISHYEQFLLFPQCFKRPVLQTRKHNGFLWEKDNAS